MQIRFLLVTGPSVAPAEVVFGPGLNVIYGGSNTGKTHLLRLINFALGASTVPEPVSEQAGYDMLHLGVCFPDGAEHTIVRPLQGGDAKLLDGLTRVRPSPAEGRNLSVRHGAKVSLSKFLLGKVGAIGARIRINAKGDTRDLSFRDLSRHVLINETKIQSTESPIQFGQYMDRPAELSTFKYLITGVDDSALDVTKSSPDAAARKAAQLELLDRMLREVDREIERSEDDFEEIERQELELSKQLELQFTVQENTESTYREIASRRRDVRLRRESLSDRAEEIRVLLSRFDLLLEHYNSDVERLEAIHEAGQLIDLEPDARCPLCGADPEHRQAEFTCEGDTTQIVEAAAAQIERTRSRREDLARTRQALVAELREIGAETPKLDALSAQLETRILAEVPAVQQVRSRTHDLVQQKLRLSSRLEMVRRKQQLQRERDGLGVDAEQDSTAVIAKQQLDGRTLDQFCRVVEDELKSWEYPESDRVFFDLTRRDISVGGKPRSANGKGVRSLLHAAFSIALMRFSRNHNRAHPGFLVLDSLFITYRDPEGSEEALLAATPLKDRAFRAFEALPDELQLIVLENVDVPDWLEASAQCIHFTGNPQAGRAGLFPMDFG